MKVLFVALPEKGHLHPLLGPAAELERRGHEVAFYSPRDVSAALGRAGFFRAYAGDPTPPDGENRGEALAARVRDRDQLRAWIRSLLIDTVDGEVARLESAVRDFLPQVIAADPMAYAAPIVAARAGLPWAGLSSSLNPVVPDDFESELGATNAWLAGARDALFARYDLRASFRVCDCLSPWLNLVFATEALTGPPPPGVELVGPSLPRAPRGDEPDFPWQRLARDRPIVYLSLGSQIYHQPRIFRTIVEALRDRAAQLVIACGDPRVAGELPPGTIAVRYAPQLALLPRVRAMITHGGANSVMEALHAGVPLLVTPICNDQFHNARFVERSGAGLSLDLQRASPAECRRAIDRLLAPGPERAAAARIGESYRASDGAARAAERIAGLARPC